MKDADIVCLAVVLGRATKEQTRIIIITQTPEPTITAKDATHFAIRAENNLYYESESIQPTCQPCGASVRKEGQICKRCAKLRGWR